MPDLTVKRTLVKSPPELWAELSEVEGLSRHLGEFGEIKISRLDPEKTVAWEGEHASGTVEIEASSWGTKVVLTAEVAEVEAVPAPAPYQRAPWLDSPPELQEESLPEGEDRAPTPRRRGFVSRWLFRERRGAEAAAPIATPEPEPQPVIDPEPMPVAVAESAIEDPADAQPDEPAAEVRQPVTRAAIDEERALAVLEGALDNLGSAHHRPFSRG